MDDVVIKGTWSVFLWVYWIHRTGGIVGEINCRRYLYIQLGEEKKSKKYKNI